MFGCNEEFTEMSCLYGLKKSFQNSFLRPKKETAQLLLEN